MTVLSLLPLRHNTGARERRAVIVSQTGLCPAMGGRFSFDRASALLARRRSKNAELVDGTKVALPSSKGSRYGAFAEGQTALAYHGTAFFNGEGIETVE